MKKLFWTIILCLLLSSCADTYTLKKTTAVVVDMGTTYAKYRGNFTYVKLIRPNGDFCYLEDVELNEYHVGQILSFYIGIKH